MAEPQRKPIDQEFTEANYTPMWGVENARINKNGAGKPANTNRRRFEPMDVGKINQYQEPEVAANTNVPESPRNQRAPSVGSDELVNYKSPKSAKPRHYAKALTNATTINSIAALLMPLQFIAVVLFAIGLLGYSQLETSWTAWALDIAAQNGAGLLGVNFGFKQLFVFGGFILVFLSLSLFIIHIALAKILGLNPLLGNGTPLKILGVFTFLMLCFLPIVPSTILWSLAIIRHPK